MESVCKNITDGYKNILLQEWRKDLGNDITYLRRWKNHTASSSVLIGRYACLVALPGLSIYIISQDDV